MSRKLDEEKEPCQTLTQADVISYLLIVPAAFHVQPKELDLDLCLKSLHADAAEQ